MKTLDLKLREKNQNNLLGIQFSNKLNIKVIRNFSTTITKIKIFGKKNCFILTITKYIQIYFFQKERILQFVRIFETKFLKIWQGLYNILFSNFLLDLNYSYKVYMRIFGISYKVLPDVTSRLFLNLGLTHQIIKNIPFFLKIKIFDKKYRKFFISGTNRQLVKQFAFSLILFKKPNIYTGKGLKIYNVKSRRKNGKKKFA